MANRSNFNRRDFLKTSGAAAGVLSTGVWSELAAEPSKAAIEKLNIACIGTANRAAASVSAVRGESIVALCDVDKN